MSKATREAKKRQAEKRVRFTRPDRFPSKVERLLDLPQGALTGAARIELTGDRRAVIDGNCGVIEMSDDVIRLSTSSGIVRLTGSRLVMSCLSDDNAVVEGKLLSVEFI